MAILPSLLFSFLSIPFSNLLISLIRTLHRFAASVIQLHAGAHLTGPPASPHLLGEHRHTASEQVILLPWEVNLGITQYKSSIARSTSGDETSNSVECVFCLSDVEEGEEVRELRCKHLFHRRCLDRWLVERRATCPLCRDALVPHEMAATKGDDAADGDDDGEELADFATVVLLLANYAPQWIMTSINLSPFCAG
ncbi:RING-H2 finger protein ATL50 [Canna indica]|uniref:RING-H2 finger protein ATL50 n=1 Tax=Canna indica TaxID=4628 RepID=A0AAQ3QDK9_9LILI|nr:RING-H2 finger protein ATL50 [Canna indica]